MSREIISSLDYSSRFILVLTIQFRAEASQHSGFMHSRPDFIERRNVDWFSVRSEIATMAEHRDLRRTNAGLCSKRSPCIDKTIV